jgi:predicted methyltransferase
MFASNRLLAVALATTVLVACGKTEAPGSPEPAAPAAAQPTSLAVIDAAIKDSTRLGDARLRDPLRKPAEIMVFAGVTPGETIVELAPGGGYDTALLSRVVGPSGKIYAVDCERLFEYRPNLRDSFKNFIEADPRSNVEYSSQRFDALELPMNVDKVWMSMFYHDTVWLGVDRAAMNRSIFEHLKPGGVFLVIDHKALPGSGESAASELHRIDPALVRSEIEAAGFKFVAESDALAHPDDPHTDSVFSDERRGKTDRFVWKFVKPQ